MWILDYGIHTKSGVIALALVACGEADVCNCSYDGHAYFIFGLLALLD